MDNLATIRRYDFLTPKDHGWGLHVCGVGARLALPRRPYQVHEAGAPFQWRHGRVLRDYGLLYLVAGGGVLHLRGGRRRLQTGDLLVLQPGVWHDYHPSAPTGWREHWVLFNGPLAARLVRKLGATRRAPVLRPGVIEPLHRLFHELLATAEANPPALPALLAGLTLHLLAVLTSRLHLLREGGHPEESAVQQAKQHLAAALDRPVAMPTLAARLGLSYRHFRRLFKASTGLAPQQYLLELRLNAAKRLLEEDGAKIAAVARRCGFTDPYYFSRLFRQKTGFAPSAWRQ